MTCPLLFTNSTVFAPLSIALNLSSEAQPDPSLLQALTCSGLLTDSCPAICPNQDLAGIGVRIAFYFQSLVTALLVIFSPTDSVPTAWAGTLLTTATVVAAIVQKAQGNLTLHHATLVLNYATLSCISSLAVAPLLPIWRLSPTEYYLEQQNRHALTVIEDASEIDQALLAAEYYTSMHKRQVKDAQIRARVILSLAILLQVVLQWAWGIYLFASPSYSQPLCSGDTMLVIFLFPFSTRRINSFDREGYRFLLWPLWLLFCLGVTLALTIILALSGSSRSEPEVSTRSSGGPSGDGRTSSAPTPPLRAWVKIVTEVIPILKQQIRGFVFWCNLFSFVLWGMFVAASELQPLKNCLFPGENSFGGLGQITAVGVSIVPLWSLCVALYKYPAMRRRRKRHEAHRANARAPMSRRNSADLSGGSGHTRNLSDTSTWEGYDYHPGSPAFSDLRPAPYIAVPMSSPPSRSWSVPPLTLMRRHGHAPQPSDGESSASSNEEFEMRNLLSPGGGRSPPSSRFLASSPSSSSPLMRHFAHGSSQDEAGPSTFHSFDPYEGYR